MFGTCAGMIMLANEVEGQMKTGQTIVSPVLKILASLHLLFKFFKVGGIDMKVCRNFYGSQKQSFEAYLELEDEEIRNNQNGPMLFIRAPGIKSLNLSKVKILAKYNDTPVAVRQNQLLATSFHPELTEDLTWHLFFLKMIIHNMSKN